MHVATEFSTGDQKRETSFSRNSGSREEVPEMEFKMLLDAYFDRGERNSQNK